MPPDIFRRNHKHPRILRGQQAAYFLARVMQQSRAQEHVIAVAAEFDANFLHSRMINQGHKSDSRYLLAPLRSTASNDRWTSNARAIRRGAAGLRRPDDTEKETEPAHCQV